MKQNAEDKPRQEDTRFGGCQGKTPMWGKPFDQFFLLLYQKFKAEREYKSQIDFPNSKSKQLCKFLQSTAVKL